MKVVTHIIILLLPVQLLGQRFFQGHVDMNLNLRHDSNYYSFIDSLNRINSQHLKYDFEYNSSDIKDDIEWIESQGYIKTNSFRLYFFVDREFNTILPSGIAPNIHYLKYPAYIDIRIRADSFETKPLYSVPISEYWDELNEGQKEKLEEIVVWIIQKTLFNDNSVYPTVEISTFLNSKWGGLQIDKRRLEEFSWLNNPTDTQLLSYKTLNRKLTKSDTFLTTGNPLVVNHDGKVTRMFIHNDLELSEVAAKASNQEPPFSINITNTHLGLYLEFPSQFSDEILWMDLENFIYKENIFTRSEIHEAQKMQLAKKIKWEK